MNSYIESNLIKAKPEYKITTDYGLSGIEIKYSEKMTLSEDCDSSIQEGYRVVYSDEYSNWIPKNVFEKAYLKVEENQKLKSKVSISEQMVEDFIVDYDISTKKDKITIVVATLKNNFTIVESAACVDPENYSEEIGANICKERIKNQVWNHLGFLLQTAHDGVNNQ